MEEASDVEKADVFSEIEPSATQLMSDLFGNYVIQKFFEFGNQEQIMTLIRKMEGQVVALSFHTYGCRVVQKAIENIPPEEQVMFVFFYANLQN